MKKFKKGDVCKIKGEGWKVRVLSSVRDEGKNWYEVEPVEFKAFSRFVEESRLSRV
jgi:hypothetical protein